MRLHLGDEVIKRRLIQVMEQLLLGYYPPKEPTEADLLAEFEARREELRRPPRFSIEHVYFNAGREAEVDAAIATINEQKLDPEAFRLILCVRLPVCELIRSQLTGTTYAHHQDPGG